MTTWLDVCRRFAESEDVSGDVLEALTCFAAPFPRGGTPAPPELECNVSFEALEASLGPLVVPVLPTVDAAQATMFGRRLTVVDEMLAEAAGRSAEGRLLRIGFRVRLAGIGRAAPPRAMRSRALADFYYSRSVQAEHRARGGDLPTVVEAARGVVWTDLGEGLRAAALVGRYRVGPQAVHLLEVDPARVGFSAAELRGGGDLRFEARRRGARAATSGGFFLYSEPDIAAPSLRYDPVGLLVDEGRVLGPPVLRRGALVVRGADTAIAVVGPEGWRLRLGAHETVLDRAWNRADGTRGPDEPTVAVVGHTVVGVGRSLPVPLHGVVVRRPGPARVGDVVTWIPPEPLDVAMAGGPRLRVGDVPTLDHRAEDFHGTAPPRTFSQDETGDRNLLPRLGVGRRPDGVLVFAAVDGRDAVRALGVTLRTLGEVLGAVGCPDALNLDGGSSKRMVIQGRVVDRPSTEVRHVDDGPAPVRPVRSALFFF